MLLVLRVYDLRICGWQSVNVGVIQIVVLLREFRNLKRCVTLQLVAHHNPNSIIYSMISYDIVLFWR